jgi:hypothetical protein
MLTLAYPCVGKAPDVMESISNIPAWPTPAPSAPLSVEAPRIGPYYTIQVVNDAVETTMVALEALADLGIGAKVDAQA